MVSGPLKGKGFPNKNKAWVKAQRSEQTLEITKEKHQIRLGNGMEEGERGRSIMLSTQGVLFNNLLSPSPLLESGLQKARDLLPPMTCQSKWDTGMRGKVPDLSCPRQPERAMYAQSSAPSITSIPSKEDKKDAPSSRA